MCKCVLNEGGKLSRQLLPLENNVRASNSEFDRNLKDLIIQQNYGLEPNCNYKVYRSLEMFWRDSECLTNKTNEYVKIIYLRLDNNYNQYKYNENWIVCMLVQDLKDTSTIKDLWSRPCVRKLPNRC